MFQVNTFHLARVNDPQDHGKYKIKTSFTGNCSTWGTEDEAKDTARAEKDRILNELDGGSLLLREKDMSIYDNLRNVGTFILAFEVHRDGTPIALILATKTK